MAWAAGRFSWLTVLTTRIASRISQYTLMYRIETISAADPSMLIRVAARALSRSVSQPPTNEPSTWPAP